MLTHVTRTNQRQKDFTEESCARFNVTILPGVILAAAPPHPHPREVGLVLVARHLLLLLPPLLRADNLVGNKARGLLNSISGSSRWCRALCVWCSCSLVVETWIRRTSRINCMQRATPSVDLRVLTDIHCDYITECPTSCFPPVALQQL